MRKRRQPSDERAASAAQDGEMRAPSSASVALLVLGLILALLAFAETAALADDWPAPKSVQESSADGEFRLTTTPAGPGKPWGTPVTATLEKRDGDQFETVWTEQLVNVPVEIMVSNDGRVVTLDTWDGVGYEHVIVVYDEGGSPVADLALEDVLTDDEIDKVSRSVSSRWWRKGGEWDLDENEHTLTIELSWGLNLRVDLASGELVRP